MKHSSKTISRVVGFLAGVGFVILGILSLEAPPVGITLVVSGIAFVSWSLTGGKIK